MRSFYPVGNAFERALALAAPRRRAHVRVEARLRARLPAHRSPRAHARRADPGREADVAGQRSSSSAPTRSATTSPRGPRRTATRSRTGSLPAADASSFATRAASSRCAGPRRCRARRRTWDATSSWPSATSTSPMHGPIRAARPRARPCAVPPAVASFPRPGLPARDSRHGAGESVGAACPREERLPADRDARQPAHRSLAARLRSPMDRSVSEHAPPSRAPRAAMRAPIAVGADG